MRRADLLVAVLLTASAALFVMLLLAFSGHLVRAPGEEPQAATATQHPAPAPVAAPAPVPEPAQPAAPSAPDPIVDVRQPPAPPAAPARPSPSPAVAAVPVVVRAANGDCWMQARAGSEDGRLLYEGTLEQGKSIRFAVKRLWLRLGAASHVVVTVGGKERTVGTGTVDLLI
jgi:hypothetical protein